MSDLEELLRSTGAVKPNDPRLRRRNEGSDAAAQESGIRKGGKGPGVGQHDSDSDWD